MGMVWTLKKGMGWNPLRTWPRNQACYCGSMQKFKKCHGPGIATCVPAQEARDAAQIMVDHNMKPGQIGAEAEKLTPNDPKKSEADA